MTPELKYHQTLEYLHVGCEKPRAYFIPYHSDKAAATGNRAASDRFLSLCGEWSFRYYRSVNDIEDFTAPDYTAEGAERLDETEFSFAFRLLPVFKNNVCPFEIVK